MLTDNLQCIFKTVEFKDKTGESIIIRFCYPKDDRDKLMEMYVNFDPGDRCLGLPPLTREGIEKWVDYLIKNGYNIVAEHNGKIVGHVAIVPLENRREVELDIFVLRPYQNRGIGQELLRNAINFCKQMGFKGIMITTQCSNLRTKRLFKKFGFVTIDSDMDECYMFLKL